MRMPDADPIYVVADMFRERCLAQEKSLLWPDANAWTAKNISSLLKAFMGQPDYGKGSFVDKWKVQLADQPVDVHRIAADVLAFYYLFPRKISQARKLENLEEVIGWKLSAVPDMALLRQAYTRSIGHPGAFYSTGQPIHLAFYLEFSKRVEV